ncbi:DOPA 4,5-dioxygenase family protein [Celerinatantimonas yamalensis]|uniref:DOPA 4,5-dioxygenase family protein n=1 Tax=Celerinatantimonas yamalensis TaxID=559956 RepID=A0ABW9G748_9GAMM
MTQFITLSNNYAHYHSHVYFDKTTCEQARALRLQIIEQLNLEVGRFHEKQVGPHPSWSFQTKFTQADFAMFIAWIDTHRQNLTVLVHAVTGDDYMDHTEHADWLGEPETLNLAIFCC